jgi:hypothetical protein
VAPAPGTGVHAPGVTVRDDNAIRVVTNAVVSVTPRFTG